MIIIFIDVFISFQIRNNFVPFFLRSEHFFKMVFIENQPLKDPKFPGDWWRRPCPCRMAAIVDLWGTHNTAFFMLAQYSGCCLSMSCLQACTLISYKQCALKVTSFSGLQTTSVFPLYRARESSQGQRMFPWTKEIQRTLDCPSLGCWIPSPHILWAFKVGTV